MFGLDTNIMSAVVTASLALFSYLVKSYFKKIHDTMACLRQEIGKLEGSVDTLSKDIRQNTVEGAVLRSEVKALWRFIDNANQRASDGGGK
jgi:uncharacterized protein Yka (UPF0111/DUF47 family)